MRGLAYLVAMTAALVFLPAALAAATPAQTLAFGPGYPDCSAQFVKSNSGIINETNRTAACGDLFGWASTNLKVQFRPLNGTPNPRCDAAGLIYAGTFTATAPYSAEIIALFGAGVQYNVCFYPVNPVVATGSVDSASVAGVDVSLPSTGTYRIDVSGTWTNGSVNVADAAYTSTDGWITPTDGYPGLGDWGDLLVNGALVDWGAYSTSHTYSYTASGVSSINLHVFDGDASVMPLVPNTGWYVDNVGSLSYTITYLGL